MYEAKYGKWIDEEMDAIEQAWDRLTPEQRQAFIEAEQQRLAQMDKIIAQLAEAGPHPSDDDAPFA